MGKEKKMLLDEMTPDTMFEQFGDVMRENSVLGDPDMHRLNEVLKQIDAVAGHNRTALTGLREDAINHHLVTCVSKKWPRVLPELLERKRTLYGQFTGRTHAAASFELHSERGDQTTLDFEADLFAELAVTDDDGSIAYDDSVQIGDWSPSNLNRTYYINAATPAGITPERIHTARLSFADLVRAYADLLDNRIITLEEATPSFKNWGEGDVQTAVLWIPRFDQLAVSEEPPRPVGDPAVCMKWNGEYFLTCLWDAPEEEPGEAILREFTEGGKIRRE